tara:strand:- start:47 stop:325 length:279 start_codon:yes stop_codon:yes gene_type:complete
LTHVGKQVYTLFGNNTLRFGNVVEEKMEDSGGHDWKFVRVDWVDDNEFEQDRQRVIQFRGYDKYSDWYRIDKIKVFNCSQMIKKIKKLNKGA